MTTKTTINPKLTPLKSYYEQLSTEETISLHSLKKEVLDSELNNLKVLELLPKEKREPSASSIDIILSYSKKHSKQKPVC